MTTDPSDAILAVLEDTDEELHWTVIQDRILRAGSLDPFETPDVRGVVSRALQALVRDGRVTKTGKGTYRLAR